MNGSFAASIRAGACRAFTGLVLLTACATSWAVPAFTLNPSAVGLTGGSVTADTINVADFASVKFDNAGGFTETGLLSVIGFQSGDFPFVAAPGLNSTYGLYFSFSGTGSSTGTLGNVTAGTFSALDFTLWGYSGTASFGIDGSNNPFTTASGQVALASGSLVEGTVTSVSGAFPVTSAAATTSFTVAPGQAGFFESPSTFYNLALASFINYGGQISAISNGFVIRNGAGTVTFGASPVPEPESYALLLAGLGIVGFVVRRRQA